MTCLATKHLNFFKLGGGGGGRGLDKFLSICRQLFYSLKHLTRFF